MIELSSTTSNPIRHIFHIADIHIRNGDLDRSRYGEYQCVMKRMIEYMDAHPSVQESAALTVIAGDLFHHKGRMDTPALKLYFWWMDQLLLRTPVLMICGNHDFRQDDPKHPDMLETMVSPYLQKRTRHPLYYLNKTEHYVYDNVGFGVVSIKDTLKAGSASGIIQNLPDYPSASVFETNDKVTHTFALFHGTIAQSALPNEQRMSEMGGYPMQWFDGYKYVLLGDNHKQQINTKPCTWAYPGSLIQQDFGESVFGHGFIEWELLAKSNARGTAKHIYNENGMVTVKWSEKHQAFMLVFGRRDTVPIEEAVGRPDFPQQPRVRIIGSFGEEQRVAQIFEECGIHPSQVITVASLDQTAEDPNATAETDTVDIREKMTQLSDLNSPKQWIDYLSKVAPELEASSWLTQPETMKMETEDIQSAKEFLPSDLVQKITDRNTRIQKAIDEYYNELFTNQQQHHIVLKHMSWDYAMCYGHGNYFDFEKIDNTVSLLNGKNAMGKSSFLDVLCIGLYGEPSKHRNMLSGKKMTAKMIHDQRPSHKSLMRVSILFQMDDDTYEITRAFTTQKKEDNCVYAQLHNAMISKVLPDRTKKVLMCEGSVAVEAWVDKHFGTIDDMLMSTIVCQLDLTNFFYLKQEEQKKILDHALQLGSIAAFGKVLKEAILAHNEWISLLRTSLQTIQSSSACGWMTEDKMQATLDDIATHDKAEKDLEHECNALLSKIGSTDALPNVADVKELQKLKNKVLTSLKKYDDIGESDMELSLMVKGEQMSNFESLKKQLKIAHEACGEDEILDIDTCKGLLESVNKQIKMHVDAKNEPSVSKQHLEFMRKSIKDWKSKYSTEWCEDPDELNAHAEVLREEIADLAESEAELMAKPVAKPSVAEEPFEGEWVRGFKIKDAQRRLAEIQESLDAAIEKRITPARSKDNYASWKKEWSKWRKDVEAVEALEVSAKDLKQRVEEYESFVVERKSRMEERKNLEKDIQECETELGELAQVPFNPDCWACQKQPTVIRQQQVDKNRKRMKKVLQKIRQYLEQCDQHGSQEEMQEELEALRDQYEKRKYYEALVDKMNAEYEAWGTAKQQWKFNEEVSNQIQTLKEEQTVLVNQVAAYSWNRWRKWQVAYEDIVACKKSKENELRAMQTFLTEYDAREKDMVMVQEEEDKWQKHEAWDVTFQDLLAKLDHFKNIEYYWRVFDEFTQQEKELKMHGENIERIMTKKKLMDELDLYHRTEMFIQWKLMREKLGHQRKLLQDKQRELVVMQTAFKEQAHQQQRVAWMESHLKEWTERKALLQQLDVKFIGDKQNGDGYKEWIYRERVVPLVQDEVNRFLATIETIRLKITYDRKCFLYFLEDRGNTPTLDKASGYQNFVVGLAMRIALARIGAVGQNVRHLFIDEGFTACDVVNIEKVPALLQGIMDHGGYQSILLMSHLEQVQEAAAMKIPIERKGVFSFIHWGSEYPVMEMEREQEKEAASTSKRRGRPKKTDIS